MDKYHEKERLCGLVCAENNDKELRKLLNDIHDSNLLARCVRKAKSDYIQEACIARIDDFDVLRQLLGENYDPRIRNKIRTRARDLYYKKHGKIL